MAPGHNGWHLFLIPSSFPHQNLIWSCRYGAVLESAIFAGQVAAVPVRRYPPEIATDPDPNGGIINPDHPEKNLSGLWRFPFPFLGWRYAPMSPNSTARPSSRLRVVVWGAFDRSKPRVRLLLEALDHLHVDVTMCHLPVWESIRDKSLIGRGTLLRVFFRYCLGYPRLLWRYLRSPPHDWVLIPYPGLMDVLLMFPFTRLRRARLAWDIFISMYDTLVRDRKKWRQGEIRARGLFALERMALRVADCPFADTQAHARYLEGLFDLEQGEIKRVWVGVEEHVFPTLGSRSTGEICQVLFYGQYIPLHGIDIIVKAAAILEQRQRNIQWTLIGTGQERPRIDALIVELGVQSIKRIDWVPYPQLSDTMATADICLGVFGISEKAQNVIPNKVFQILASGRPLITSATPGVTELLAESQSIQLVPPGDPLALAQAVESLEDQLRCHGPAQVTTPLVIGVSQIATQLSEILQPK